MAFILQSVIALAAELSRFKHHGNPIPRFNPSPSNLISTPWPKQTGFAQQCNDLDVRLELSQPASARETVYPRSPYTSGSVALDPAPGGITINHGPWLINFLWIDTAFPAQLASQALEQFYQHLLERLEPYVNPSDNMQSVFLGIHELYLEFTCDTEAISWVFVRDFVARMLNATRRGFAGRFVATLYYSPTQTWISVGLGILNSQELVESGGSS